MSNEHTKNKVERTDWTGQKETVYQTYNETYPYPIQNATVPGLPYVTKDEMPKWYKIVRPTPFVPPAPQALLQRPRFVSGLPHARALTLAHGLVVDW